MKYPKDKLVEPGFASYAAGHSVLSKIAQHNNQVLEQRRKTEWALGAGIMLSNLWSETRDERLCKNVAAGMRFEDFVGIGLGRYDVNNLRRALK